MASRQKTKKNPFLVLSTAPTQKEAERLAQKLLNQKLAACINILYPAVSFFSWKGKREKVREALLVIKTTASQFKKIESLFRKFHSYEVPELIGWPITKGSAPYLTWLRDSVR